MRYMPRLARVKVIVVSGADVIEHEDKYLLAKNNEDLEKTTEKYKEMFSNEGEVFVRTEWLVLAYSNEITNDFAADAKFLH